MPKIIADVLALAALVLAVEHVGAGLAFAGVAGAWLILTGIERATH